MACEFYGECRIPSDIFWAWLFKASGSHELVDVGSLCLDDNAGVLRFQTVSHQTHSVVLAEYYGFISGFQPAMDDAEFISGTPTMRGDTLIVPFIASTVGTALVEADVCKAFRDDLMAQLSTRQPRAFHVDNPY